jgi:hypothetical protein
MSYPATQTFWLEPTDEVAVGLRRYHSGDGNGWTCANGYHSALVYTGSASAQYEERDGRRMRLSSVAEAPPSDDTRWPTECGDGCGYRFTDDDHWQPWDLLVWQRTDTGEKRFNHSNHAVAAPGIPIAEPGACWDATWMPFSRGPDGICLVVRCPNGHDWMVDSEASNCTRKGEPHQCWVRHGDPRECKITVDKNGDTCSAGAGSIQAGDYHGFLQAGILTAG